jgi:hypothetical protein
MRFFDRFSFDEIRTSIQHLSLNILQKIYTPEYLLILKSDKSIINLLEYKLDDFKQAIIDLLKLKDFREVIENPIHRNKYKEYLTTLDNWRFSLLDENLISFYDLVEIFKADTKNLKTLDLSSNFWNSEKLNDIYELLMGKIIDIKTDSIKLLTNSVDSLISRPPIKMVKPSNFGDIMGLIVFIMSGVVIIFMTN